MKRTLLTLTMLILIQVNSLYGQWDLIEPTPTDRLIGTVNNGELERNQACKTMFMRNAEVYGLVLMYPNWSFITMQKGLGYLTIITKDNKEFRYTAYIDEDDTAIIKNVKEIDKVLRLYDDVTVYFSNHDNINVRFEVDNVNFKDILDKYLNTY